MEKANPNAAIGNGDADKSVERNAVAGNGGSVDGEARRDRIETRIGDSGAIDPNAAVGRRKRGRPSNAEREARGETVGSPGNVGSAKSADRKKAPVSVRVDRDKLAASLVGLHVVAAGFLKTPILTITPQEGKTLADAAADCADCFDIPIDPKTQAIIGLVFACASIYGPRVVMLALQRAAAKRQSRAESASPPIAPEMPVGDAAPIPPGVAPLNESTGPVKKPTIDLSDKTFQAPFDNGSANLRAMRVG